MSNKIYEAVGIALLGLPTTKSNRTNNKRRNVNDMESTSAAHMLSVTGVSSKEPLIFCGKYNKAIPVLRQLIKKTSRPFVLIGTKRDLEDNSCLRILETTWESDILSRYLPDGNGILLLKSGANTNLELKEYISEWDSHLIILCIGNGLQIDQELLNLLNSIGHYILLSENLQRSVKYMDGYKLTAADLLSSMEYILVSSIGTAGKELLKVLPDFEYEKITNTTDFSMHLDSPHKHKDDYYNHNGGGLRLSQSKTQESRCIFTQEDLMKLQDSNVMVIHNARSSHTWVARVTS